MKTKREQEATNKNIKASEKLTQLLKKYTSQ